jgi:hypothetical protein
MVTVVQLNSGDVTGKLREIQSKLLPTDICKRNADRKEEKSTPRCPGADDGAERVHRELELAGKRHRVDIAILKFGERGEWPSCRRRSGTGTDGDEQKEE